MPPKKSKAVAGSSQPAPLQTRQSGRRRKSSDASQASERPTSSQGMTTPKDPTKKRKRGRTAKSETPQQPEVIVEELEEEIVTEPPSDALTGAGQDETMEEIEVSQSEPKRVHFGGGHVDVEVDERVTATNITPHPRKMSVKRRISTSPTSSAGAASKRLRISSSRPSLPSSLSFSTDGASDVPVRFIQDYLYAPLSVVLAERISQRLEETEGHKRDSNSQQELDTLRQEAADREERIEELVVEIENQKRLVADASDDDAGEYQHLRELEGELLALRRNEHKALAQLRHIDGANRQMLVLQDSQEKIEYPRLPTPASMSQQDGIAESPRKSIRMSQAFSDGASQITISRTRWETERKKFEDAVMTLSHEAKEAKAALKVLEIELEALGFAEEGAPTSLVMQSIRLSFDSIRDDLAAVLPGFLPEDASNGDLIQILITSVREYVAKLKTQDEEIQDKTTLAKDLSEQVNGLLDHLADAEIRKKELEMQWQEMDHDNDKKDRKITELENEADTALDERDELHEQLEQVTEEVKLLRRERDDLTASVEKLAASLEHYRREETRLAELIIRMEEEHRESVVKMNQEREETVNELETRLDAMTEAKEGFEEDSDERRRAIDHLEAKIEVLEDKRDSLTEALEIAQVERDAEKKRREELEEDYEQKVSETQDLEARVEKLEEELDEVTNALDDLRKLNDSERQQREAAEQDLDDRNIEIDELSKKLNEAGKEANTLRMQLFGKQQEHERIVKELEDQMSERDQQYQSDMSDEVTRREHANTLAQERTTTILKLERQLEELELSMRVQITERDERIEELEATITERDSELSDLRAELSRVEEERDLQAAQSRKTQFDLETSIGSLQQTIADHEETISTIRLRITQEAESHTSELQDRNAAIIGLNANIAALQAQIDNLEIERTSLERRVEEEASQMLQLQGDKDDEITELRDIIEDKQAKILAVEIKAEEADKAWQAVLAAREEEIHSLQTQSVQTSQKVSAVRVENTEIKSRFRGYVQRSAATIAALRAELERVRNLADEEDAQLRTLGDDELEAIEAMNAVAELETVVTETKTMTTSMMASSTLERKSAGVVSSTAAQSSSAAAAASGTKKGRGRKKRVLDSGIGMEDSVLG